MQLRHLAAPALAVFAALALALACTSTHEAASRPVTLPPPVPTAEKPADFPGVHNVVAYGPGLYSGSVPEGDAGFESLANMGIRTIISVDGAAPEADEAESRGMRYVHFPVTYGGIDEERRLEITRAVRDLPGPVYIHCHHGKHRSAAAGAAAAVALGRLDNDAAVSRMKASGTAPNYTGLYACATESKVLTNAQISAAPNDFPSRWKTSGMVDSMVAIDAANDQLKALEKAQWGVPKDHPDLVPGAVAGNLENLLRGLLSDHETTAKSEEFRDMLKSAADAAQALEDGIVSKASTDDINARMKTVAQSCKACHQKYRD